MSEAAVSKYYFRAGSSDGNVLQGELNAASDLDAMRQLKTAGYTPIRLQATPIRESILDREIRLLSPRRLNNGDCESFSRELAILLNSGIEVTVALGILIESLPRRSRARAFALGLRQWLRMGASLSESIRNTQFKLPPDFAPAVEAGERAGRVGPALALIADRLHEAGKLSRTVSGALAYPLFLVVTAIAVILILAFFVAPNLVSLFHAMERPVPAVIDALERFRNFVVDNPLAIGVSAAGTGIVLIVLSRLPSVSLAARRLSFALPVLGPTLAWAAAGRFAATLRLFLANGIPAASALPSSFAAAGFPSHPNTGARLAEEIRRGARISDVLEHAQVFPPKVVHLLHVGEANARLTEVLDAVVEEARLRFEQRLNLLSLLLAPVLIVAVGTMVGWIIFTVFSALLTINDLTFS